MLRISLANSVQNTVDEASGIFARKFLGKLDGFVDDRPSRRFSDGQLMHRQPQNCAVNRSDAIEPPVLAVLLDHHVQVFDG